MTIDTSEVREGTMRVEVINEKLKNIKTTPIKSSSGNFIGLSKLSDSGCKKLIKEMKLQIHGNYDDYYTLAIDKMARRGEVIGCCDINGMLWRERMTIDTEKDYEEVQSLINLF